MEKLLFYRDFNRLAGEMMLFMPAARLQELRTAVQEMQKARDEGHEQAYQKADMERWEILFRVREDMLGTAADPGGESLSARTHLIRHWPGIRATGGTPTNRAPARNP